MTLSFERRGAGEPLLLVHGTGSSRSVWAPLMESLAAECEVIAVDLPGHGQSPLAARDVPPNPIGYARVVADLLDELDLDRVHAVGNSVGGWTSLELAKLGRARSVVALGPAGLWRRRPLSAYYSLRSMRRMSPLAMRIGPVALRTAVGRTLMLGQIYGRPWRVPPEAALESVRGMAGARGFDEHLEATNAARFEGGAAIDVPVTVAFGSRERLIPRRGRLRDELPAQTNWLTLPRCGHVPVWDDPALVARIILDGTVRAAVSRRPAVAG